MFRSSNFYKLLDEATNSHRLDVDWDIIMKINDLIRQNDVSAKDAINAISKKISNSNSHTAFYALVVLESCVKNCGSPVHDEISTKTFMEQFRSIIENCTHDKVRTKALDLIQSWAFAFRNIPKYRAVNDCATIMKANGFKFPVLKESDAMFVADNAPKWEEGTVCHRCRTQFSLLTRKHHCRACGQVFCHECSSHESTLPRYGIEKPVRVCDSCFEMHKNCTSHSGNDSGHSSLQKGKRRPHKSRKPSPSWSKNTLKPGGTLSKAEDLPSEYLNSSLAQQPQTAPKKSEDELKEEEDIQLALALSQSEAESKQSSYRPVSRSKSFSPPATNNKVSQFENEDPELSRYLNRTYWETRANNTTDKYYEREEKSIPVGMPNLDTSANRTDENGVDSSFEIDDFITALRGQVEIFVNRMKSNSSRGRSISNDSSVQSLFLNITTMHSQLLKYIQEQDDSRVYYEGLQDKLTQVKDARAALNALREEHRERLRREAEIAERQRQIQMAQKLEIMRQKKQEYLQYQRELALQHIRDQERELHMRQEQQKQQYRLGGPYGPHPFMVPSQGVSAFEPVSSMGMNMNNLPPNAAPPGQFVPPQFATSYPPGQNVPPMSGPPQQPMGAPGSGAMMMNQPPSMQPPPNAYVPVNPSSPGQMVNAPPPQGGQYAMGQPPIMHPNHHQQPHLKMNSAVGQPVPIDAQNGHPMMGPGGGVAGVSGGGPMGPPHMMGPPGIAPPSVANRIAEPSAHMMGSPQAGIQHPGIMRSMVPPSSSPLSSPSSSSEHSLIQHGPQPTPSAPSATSTPQPEEKEEIAELISFD